MELPRETESHGHVLKHKSRLYVDGSQQEFGEEYWDVYAPINSWTTIRLLLILLSILDLKQRQVDYAQAFPQAPLDDPVIMRMPQGWHINKQGNLTPHHDPTFHE
jgi:hypothetical protein